MNTVNVLIVDDEERFLVTTKRLMDKQGATTITCRNGTDALEILKNGVVDVVLLDVKMPGIDGLEVLRRTKQEHPNVEVILLTGQASVDSAMEGLKLGAFDYLMKPTAISDIYAKVIEAFEKKNAKERKTHNAKSGSNVNHIFTAPDNEPEQ